MHRKSVLLAVPCDLKKLPIGGLEEFVLSQVREPSRVEEVAANAGLEVEEMLRLAQRLSDLGAIVVEEEQSKSKRPSGAHLIAKNPTPPSSERAMASMVPVGAVPVPRKRADLRALHIAPREGFVLSQIDGATSVGDLVEITHLSLREINESLRALEAVGVVDLPNSKRRMPTPALGTPSQAPKRAPTPARGTPSQGPQGRTSTPARGIPSQAPQRRISTPLRGTPSQGPQGRTSTPARGMPSQGPQRRTSTPARGMPSQTPRRRNSAPPEGARSDAPRSSRKSHEPPGKPPRSAPPDVSEADRAIIIDMAARVDVPSHYEALGVERDADTKAIRRAYHALASQFHPDRFFGKNLGPQKQPLERIFDRITKAYDTLSRKAEREAHDATLVPAEVRVPKRASMPMRRSSRKMKAAARASSSKLEAARPACSKPPSRASSAKLEAVRNPSRAPKTTATRAPAPAGEAIPIPGPAKDPTPAPLKSPAPVATSAHAKAATPAPAPGKASEDAPGSPKMQTVPPAVGAASAPMRVTRADALLRMFAGAGKHSKATPQDHLGVFLRAAKEALEKDDVVGAANHYRLAVQCTDDRAVHTAFAETEAKAKVRIHDASLMQARAAESAGRWGEAAAKYLRAYESRPEPWVAERAANAMREDGKELKRAAHLAEQAVLAEPQNAHYRVTLGEVYLDAGVMTRAAGEAGRASALAPNDPRVQALASRVAQAKRG